MRLGVGRGFAQNHPTGEEQSKRILLTLSPGGLGKPWGGGFGATGRGGGVQMTKMFWASGEGGRGGGQVPGSGGPLGTLGQSFLGLTTPITSLAPQSKAVR